MTDNEVDDIATLKLEPGSIENGVLIGRDRYLFLAGGAHAVLDIVNGVRVVDERSLCNFRNNITQRRDWAAQRSVPYWHLVFPDKQSIIPEFWPFERCLKLSELYLNHWVSERLPILYPVSLLRDIRDGALSRIDTHVTPIGSIHVAAAVVKALTDHDPDPIARQLLGNTVHTQRKSGDLGSKLSRSLSALDPVFSGQVPGYLVTNGLEGGNNGLVDIRINPDAAINRRCVFFGDSFGRDICQYLQFWFAEVIFFRTPFFHQDLAEQCKPDILVTENVERYLDVCLPDLEAPEFSSYAKRDGVIYAPSKRFSETFTDILQEYPESVTGLIGGKQDDKHDHGSDAGNIASTVSPSVIALHAPFAALSAIELTAHRQADIEDERIIEAIKLVSRTRPAFFVDQSTIRPTPFFPDIQDIHSTLFAERAEVLLFGPSIQVAHGQWWSESRAYGEQFVDMVTSQVFRSTFPGPKPLVEPVGAERHIDFMPIADQIISLEEPLFLATPLEPLNWGRWISTVICKIGYYRRLGAGRKLLCVVALPWQKEFLKRLGVLDNEIQPHDPGQTYWCKDLASIEYNVTNMTVSALESERFKELRDECTFRVIGSTNASSFSDKIFISRLSASKRNPNYRVLQNEQQLINALTSIGYDVIEPELLTFDQQVAAFGNARSIVSLGGAAIYNASFCKQDTKFISIESSEVFLNPHMSLLSSLKLNYGIVVGVQDETDPSPVHKRWTVDVPNLLTVIRDF